MKGTVSQEFGIGFADALRIDGELLDKICEAFDVRPYDSLIFVEDCLWGCLEVVDGKEDWDFGGRMNESIFKALRKAIADWYDLRDEDLTMEYDGDTEEVKVQYYYKGKAVNNIEELVKVIKEFNTK